MVRRSALLLLVSLASFGCGDSPAEPNWDDLRAQLAQQRATWEAARTGSYTMVQLHECFCNDWLLRPAVVSVTVGAGGTEVVASATWQGDGSGVAAGDLPHFFSIGKLFDLIDNAAAAKVPDIQVQFHAQLGYPTAVLIDYESRSTQDDQVFTISDVAFGS